MASSQLAANTNRKPVLVVSDTHVNRIVVSRIVESIGMAATAVPSKDAAGLLQQQPFAMIIIDGGPADADGVEIIRQLSPEIPPPNRPLVIFISSGTALPPAVEASNVDAVVSKPITSDRLEAAILRLANQTYG